MSTARDLFAGERVRHGALLGREDFLAEIDRLIEIGDRGFVLLVGGPGAGKSAVLWHYTQRAAASERPVPHHFIRSGTSDWDYPYAIQASLVAQLEALFPDEHNPDARPERRLVELLLRIANQRLIPQRRKLVIVLDGLNEVTGAIGEDPIQRLLPHALPPGVFLLGSIRTGHPYLASFVERGARVLDLDRGLTETGGRHRATRAFWAHYGPALGLPTDFRRLAIRSAEGNPLHAVLLRHQLSQLDEGARALRFTRDIPYGLLGMLESVAQALWQTDGSERAPAGTETAEAARASEAHALLGVLAVGREALPPGLIGAVLGTAAPAQPVFELHAALRAFLLAEETPLGVGYRLGHECFRELLSARLGPQELRRLHRLVAQRLAAWPCPRPSDTTLADFLRRYALRHGVYHNVQAAEWQRVETLLSDVDFLIARCGEAGTQALEHDYSLAAASCPDPVRQKEWRDLRRAVREESHWLRRDLAALPSLLYNRLRRYGWPGSRIARALAMNDGLPQLRLQRGLGGHERTLIGHASSVYGCALTRDGKRLVSASWDRTLKVWDLASGQVLRTLKGHAAEVTAVAILPDEERVISGSSDCSLRVWSLQTGQKLMTLLGHTGEVTCLAVFPDGYRVLSGARDKTLRIWDLRTGQVVQALMGHVGWVTACALLDEERVISGAWDKTIRIWNADTGQEQFTLTGHAAGVRALAVAPGGRRVLSGSEDHTLKLWDVSTGRELTAFQGHTSGVTACALLPDGRRVVSTSKDKTLRVWDLQSGQALQTMQGHSGWVTACAVLPDGRHVVSGSDDYSIKVWDLTAGQELSTLPGHSAAVTTCAAVPRQAPLPPQLLTGSADRTLKLWDLVSGRATKTLRGHLDLVTCVSVLPDGQRAVSGSWDKSVRLWDLEAGTEQRALTGHQWFVTCVAALPDGQRAISGSWDKTLRLWDLASGQTLQTLLGHMAQVTCVAALPDGQRVLSGSRDGTLRLWDLASGRELLILRGHIDGVTACAIVQGERALSGSRDRTVKLWDLTTGAELLTLAEHGDQVTACATTEDGRRAVSASEDDTLKVWDLADGRCLDTVYGEAPFDCVAVAGGPGDDERICAGDRLGHLWLLLSPSADDEDEVFAAELLEDDPG